MEVHCMEGNTRRKNEHSNPSEAYNVLMHENLLSSHVLPSGCNLQPQRGWVDDGRTTMPLSEADLFALSLPPQEHRYSSNPPLGCGLVEYGNYPAPQRVVHIVLEPQISNPKALPQEKLNADLVNWLGDQTLSYDEEFLRIGDAKERIPRANDATNRQLLLQMLVDDYNADAIGVSTIVFEGELRKMQLKSSTRAMETAVCGLNEEVKRAFKIRGFIKLKRGMAMIPRKE